MEVAEGVNESCVEEGVEFGAFFIGEAGVLAVFLGSGEVDLVVGDVEIAAEDDRLALFFDV